jgi:hypothetical protein
VNLFVDYFTVNTTFVTGTTLLFLIKHRTENQGEYFNWYESTFTTIVAYENEIANLIYSHISHNVYLLNSFLKRTQEYDFHVFQIERMNENLQTYIFHICAFKLKY